jgi:hypothetical protein
MKGSLRSLGMSAQAVYLRLRRKSSRDFQKLLAEVEARNKAKAAKKEAESR